MASSARVTSSSLAADHGIKWTAADTARVSVEHQVHESIISDM